MNSVRCNAADLPAESTACNYHEKNEIELNENYKIIIEIIKLKPTLKLTFELKYHSLGLELLLCKDVVIELHDSDTRRLYILCWRKLSQRRLLPAVSPAAGHLTTPTVAGLPGLCENSRPTTSKSSPI